MAKVGEPGPQPRRTSGWQLALVALALAIFATNVVVPGVIVGIGFTGLIGLTGAATVLQRIGALTAGVFEGAAQLSVIFLSMTLIAFTAVTAWNGYQRMAGRAGHPRSLLRWPWLLLGLLLFLSCQWALPEGNQRSALPVLPGALVIAFSVWAVLSISALIIRMSVGGLRLSWRLARASPFGAGVLTLGALAATALALAVVPLAKALKSESRAIANAQPAPCDSASWECSRQALLGAGARRTGAIPATYNSAGEVSVAHLGALGSAPASNMHACLETQFQQQEMMAKAHRIARGIVTNSADAEDLVQAILLNICMRREPPLDFEPYFLRAVDFGARRRFGQVSRACELESLPEPACNIRPDDQYVELESHHALRAALCALPKEQQDVLRMRYFEGMDETEIGLRLDITHAAARKRVQRARDQLRTEFLQRCQ
ncbi:sigma-70 family RNA polymerase sigma factor [Myxococcus qinghaiensis]|uniref:sigma-70 family RNA polymerase sigma factor n=1 Tax=Myxococcus qinghaiensis TaxID=2906758 RepID=UPI0020A75697|nr:sigma-70 family RNA polymerase sigma factor [Myxococcus qinghaiensis]MCP3167294.1 sigma-70 family RNA polymerase sigma factor [Myxococcus qinghaiensis]